MRGRCYYTLSELSKITGVSVSTLKREIRENKLKISKLNRKYKVTLTELKNYLGPEKYEEFFYLSAQKSLHYRTIIRYMYKELLKKEFIYRYEVFNYMSQFEDKILCY